MRRMLSRYPRTIVLGALASLVIVTLGAHLLRVGADTTTPIAVVALLLCAALCIDSLLNLRAFERERWQRHVELENAFIEAQSKLDLLVQWLEGRDVEVDLDEVAAEVLLKQLRAND